MHYSFSLFLLLSLASLGCGKSTAPRAADATVASVTPPLDIDPSCSYEKDRAAILAMAGEFDVKFEYHEQEPKLADYELKHDHVTDAHEVALIIENTPRRISLQHLLRMPGGRVLKHWRQDWTFEDDTVFNFQGFNQWQRDVSPSAKCAWSQAVFHVDDGPRYESRGTWKHEDGGRSVWESGVTGRPLPRREYSTRDDYDLIIAINRHVITADGWVHEQDNIKRRLRNGKEEDLVHEKGINTYKRNESGFQSVAQTWWDENKSFWGAAKGSWDAIFAAHTTLTLHEKVKGQRMFELAFPAAMELEKADAAKQKAAFDGIVKDYIAADGVPAEGIVKRATDAAPATAPSASK